MSLRVYVCACVHVDLYVCMYLCEDMWEVCIYTILLSNQTKRGGLFRNQIKENLQFVIFRGMMKDCEFTKTSIVKRA